MASVSPWIVQIEVYRDDQTVTTGSGVVLRPDGLIVTAAHLVAAGDQVRAVTGDGHRHDTATLGVDHWTDIAVVLIVSNPAALPVARLGTTAHLQPGDQAFLIGSSDLTPHPVVGHTGPIDALDQGGRSPAGVMLHRLIEIRAKSTAAGAGGAVVNQDGSLIGIATTVTDRNDDSTFATPIEVVHAAATDIISRGSARHGRLGLQGSDAQPEQLVGTGRRVGVVVVALDPDGPAATAGLQRGDVILDVNGEQLDGMADLIPAIRFAKPDTSVTLTLWHDGEIRSIDVVLAELPPFSVANERWPEQ